VSGGGDGARFGWFGGEERRRLDAGDREGFRLGRLVFGRGSRKNRPRNRDGRGRLEGGLPRGKLRPESSEEGWANVG